VRAADDVNNWSAVSNTPVVTRLLDTAAPATPTGLAASLAGGGVHLRWNANAEVDLAGYRVYRTDKSGGSFTRLNAALITSADYLDAAAPDSASLWYEVSSVDGAGNESARSAPFRVWLHGAGITALRLQPVYPNPSSLSEPVTLPIDVPAGGPVDARLEILSSAGERVRTIDLPGLAPGTTGVSWDGRNDAGRTTAPGVYRALLHVGGSVQIVKLVRRP
jgi:hypothetical protein